LPFSVSNGVRQGGVLSPILFNVYMDELLLRLQRHDIGCHIGQKFMGALCYADDLSVLCPTVNGLQSMVNVCLKFAKEYNVTFNPSKTACMSFGHPSTNTVKDVYLDANRLTWVTSIKYLGNMITSNLKDDQDIQMKRGYFYRSVNCMCAKFKNVLLNTDVAAKLFQTYCCSFYGSQAWSMSSSSFEMITIAWNKAVRRIFNLPYTTHRYLLPFVSQSDHIRDNLLKRFNSFLQTWISSENSVITQLALNAHFSNSPIGLNKKYSKIFSQRSLTLEEQSHGQLISSLLKIREQMWSVPEFEKEEVEIMLHNICTS